MPHEKEHNSCRGTSHCTHSMFCTGNAKCGMLLLLILILGNGIKARCSFITAFILTTMASTNNPSPPYLPARLLEEFASDATISSQASMIYGVQFGDFCPSILTPTRADR
ncbi:hypothetical protein AcW1_008015 [Taiwanofungus camphoratus]|nr:hypothetical protein AcV5_008315 [Antrodia cinnamomea]KAI0950808.1 hypothetical protein AcW1_008015 [Antrodia cinnamomea]KAI0955718.1 hypothetical protein AcV7_006307 [Antrodia cinnamomea]